MIVAGPVLALAVGACNEQHVYREIQEGMRLSPGCQVRLSCIPSAAVTAKALLVQAQCRLQESPCTISGGVLRFNMTLAADASRGWYAVLEWAGLCSTAIEAQFLIQASPG